MNKIALLTLLMLLMGTASAANTINMTTLKIVGLPAGVNVPLQIDNPLGTYKTVMYKTTNWTTTLSIPYANAVITTYGGNIPYQFMGNGTTLLYHGTTYTINEIASAGFTGFIMSNSRTTVLPFYAYFNQSQWNAQQANELMSIGVSANSPIIIGLISNITNSTAYGATQQSGNYVAAGAVKKYATYSNGTINFIATSVVQQQSYACITTPLSSASYCTNATVPMPIRFVITPTMQQQGYYWANFTMTSHLLANNKANFNFSIQDMYNSTMLAPLTIVSNTNSISVFRSYKVPLTHQIEIMFNSGGTSNYSKVIDDPITVPTSIIGYYPINVVNTNSVATASGLQIYLPNLPVNVLLGNYLVFNGLSGATLPTWAETYNSAWANFGTSVIAGSTSANGVYYIGGAASGTNLFISGNNIGEAPQLSTSYAQYDNGNYVFGAQAPTPGFYWDFYGTSLPTDWSDVGITTVTVSNGLSLSGGSGWGYLQNTGSVSLPYVEDQYVKDTGADVIGLGASGQSGPAYGGYTLASEWMHSNQFAINWASGGMVAFGSPSTNVWYLVTGYAPSTGNPVGYVNYGTSGTGSGVAAGGTIRLAYYADGGTATMQWGRTRVYPPSGIMPTVSYGTLQQVTTQLVATPNPFTISNKTIDVGQISISNTVISNALAGTTSYTGNWLFYAPASSNIILSNTIIASLPTTNNALTLTINAISSTSMKLTFNGIIYYSNAIGTNTIYGIWTFNAYAKDANGDLSPSPVLSNTITVRATPSVSTPIPSNILLDFGQSVVYNTILTGTGSAFTVNLVRSDGIVINSLTGQSAGTLTFASNIPAIGSDVFNVIATDTGTTTPFVFNSLTNTIVVAAVQTVGLLTESNTVIDNGQYSLLTAGATSGGTSPFTYSYFSQASCAGASIGSGTTLLVNPSSTTTYTFNSVDSATTKNVVCSASNTITVRATPTVSTPIPSNILLDFGQYVVYNTILTGTGSAFTVNLVRSDGIVINSLTGQSAGTLTFASNIPAVGTDVFNVIATDTGTTTPFVFNSLTNTIVVAAVQTVGLLTESNTVIDNGQYSLLTAGATSGGTSPFTYSYFSQASCGGASIGSGTTLLVNPSSTTTYTFNSVDSATTKNVVCSASNTITVRATPTVTTPIPSNILLDFGQSVVYNTILTGTGSAFTVNLVRSDGIVINSLTGQSAGTLTFASNIPAVGTDVFNVIATDTGTTTPFVFNSLTNTIVVAAVQTVGLLTESNTVIDNGQYSLLTAGATSGGTSPFTYSYFSQASCAGASIGSGTTLLVNPSSTTTYTFNSVDSATTKNVVCSASNTITVRATPTVSTPIPSNILLDFGQSVVYNTILTGTGSAFTVNLVRSDGIVINSLTGQSAGTLTFASNIPAVGTDVFNVIATDTGTTTPFVFNSVMNSITVLTAPTSKITFTNAGGNSITYGATAIANDIITGGSGSFTWAWTINNAGATNAVVSTTQTSNTLVSLNAGSYVYNVIITDTGTTTPYVSALSQNVLTVLGINPTLTLSIPANYAFNGNGGLASFTISNSLTGTLYLNGVSVATTTSSNTYTTANAIGTYAFVFNTLGNTNYNPISISNTFIISPSTLATNSIFTPFYAYKLSNGNIYSTSNVFNLLNYSYFINVNSIYGINTIAINFGANALPASNIITVANSPLAYNAVIWNIYQNNNLNSYNVIITVNDIYGNSNTITIVQTANTYVYPYISKPQIFLTSTATTSTYTKIHTPIMANTLQGSFTASNIIFLVDGYNSVSIGSNSISYQYQSTSGSLTMNDEITDINGFSTSNSITGDSVLSYNPGTVTFEGSTIYALISQSFPFNVIAGTYYMNNVNIYWGDGSNTLYSFGTPVTSGNFILTHTYAIPQTYVLSAFSTDNSPLGGIASETLTNPSITISTYTPPTITGVLPSNRFNGANDNTENFTFYLQAGSVGLKNLTINWNDADNKVSNTFTTLTMGQLSFSVPYTFIYQDAYKTNATICDVQGGCFTYPTYITIGIPPVTANQIAQEKALQDRANNQTALDKAVAAIDNPTVILTAIAIGGAIIIGIVYSVNEVKKKKQ